MKYVSYSHYFTWRHWTLIYALIILFSLAPLLSASLASILGWEFGCGEIGSGPTTDCPGGRVLGFLFTLGWFGLISIPFGFFLLLLLAVAHIIWYFNRKSGQN